MKALSNLLLLLFPVVLFGFRNTAFTWESAAPSMACTLTCPADIVVDTDPGLCSAVVNYSVTITEPGTCLFTPILSIGLASGSNFPVGTTDITYSGTNELEEDISCSFTVTVNDGENPSITCPSNIVVSNDPEACTANVTVPIPTTSDNCSVATVINDFNGTADASDSYPVGITNVSWTVTDDSGNTTDCLMTISVQDVSPPFFNTCPGDQNIATLPGECTAVATWVDPTAGDNCSIANTSSTHNSGDIFSLGTTTVIYTIFDPAGNSNNNCQFDITVTGGTPPSITCPINISANNDSGVCGAIANYSVIFDPGCAGVGILNQVSGLPDDALFPVGTTVNTFELVDGADVLASCSFSVSVTDTESPNIANCPSDITANGGAGCSSAVNWTEPIALDNCAVNSFNSTHTSGSTFPLGTTTVTYTALDDAGNNANCQFDITIVDNSTPTISCPSDIAVDNDPGECGALVNYTINTSGSCLGGGTLTQTAGLPSGALFPVGTTINTFEFLENGTTVTCSFNVIVSDTENPAINNCPGNLSFANDPGDCSASVVWPDPTITDNCPGVTFATTHFPGDIFPLGTTTVTYTALDAIGNTGTCQFEVTVTDEESPVFSSCPSNITIGCNTEANWTLPIVTDNCNVAVVNSTHDPGNIFPLGTTTVIYTAEDDANNTATCQFDVIVLDNGTPIISCPGDILIDNDPSQCGAIVDYNVTASSGCTPGGTLTQITGLASGAVFPIGTTTNTFEFEDNNGTIVSCSFDVIVSDTEFPELSNCPPDIEVDAFLGTCFSVVSWPTPSVTDNCTGVNLSSSFNPGGNFSVGTTLVIYTATDASNNATSCQFNVTVNDNESPNIANCPGDINVDCGDTPSWIPPTATDNCDLASFTSSHTPDSSFPLGITLVSYLATDEAGNETTCQFEVTVGAITPPSISCPDDIVVNTEASSCEAVVNYTVDANSDCPGGTLTQTEGLVSGASFPLGVITNTFEFTDIGDNTVSCSFTVTVEDREAPIITNCPNNISVDCGAIPNWTAPTALDNCNLTSFTSSHTPDNSFPFGVTVVSYLATDESGNESICQFEVTVEAITLPTITCPTDIIVDTDLGLCEANVNYTIEANSDCPNGTLTRTEGLVSGASFPLGVTTNTFEFTDIGDNTVSCSFTVTVEDNEAPSINCPENVIIVNDLGDCEATVTIPLPSISDNCGVVSFSNNVNGGTNASGIYPVGETIVNWVGTDDAGNSNSCQISILVQDVEAPIVSNCPTDITVTCSDIADWVPPIAADNCNLASFTNSHEPNTSFPDGSTTVSYTATDDAGNNTVCQFNVIVVPIPLPIINCPTDVVVNSDPGTCSAVIDYDVAIESDCPGGNFTRIAGLASGANFPVGITTNTFSFTDIDDNMVDCSFTVTVNDNEMPLLSNCPVDITISGGADCNSEVNWTVPMVTDNCSVTSFNASHEPNTIFPIGETSVTYTVIDEAGNTASCSFNIIVIDSTVPSLSCPQNIVVNNDPGSCDAVVDFVVNVGNTCAGVQLNQTEGLESGASFPVGVTTNTLELMDDEGAVITNCSFSITVNDTEAPILNNCPEDINLSADPNSCTAVANWIEPIASDNCSIAGLVSSHSSGTTFPLGTTTVSYTTTDNAGNESNCQFNITVIDDNIPSITCPSTIVVESDPGQCGAIVNYDFNISNTCSEVQTRRTGGLASGAFFPAGTTINTIEVVDENGGTLNSCSFAVQVEASTVVNDLSLSICEGSSVTVGNSTFDTSGNYQVQLTATSGCDSIVNLTLTVSDLVEVFQEESICEGESILLGGALQTTAGTYIDTLQSTNSCDSIIHTELSVFSPSNVNIMGPNTICVGASILLSVGSFNSYFWTPGGATTQTLEVTVPGTYTVQVTDENGCQAEDVITIEEITCNGAVSADFRISQDTACVQHFVQFTDLSSDNATERYWDFGNGNFSTERNPFTIYPETGTFTVTLAVGDGEVMDTMRKEIFVYPKIEASFVTDVIDICEPHTISFIDQSSTSFKLNSWLWNFGDGARGSIPNPVHSYTNSDTVNVTFIIRDEFACVDSINQDVIVEGLASATEIAFAGEDQSFCNNAVEAMLQANPPQIQGVSGSWSQSTTQQSDGAQIIDPDNPSTNITGLEADKTYVFTWTLIDEQCGAFSSDEVVISLSQDLLQRADAGRDINICSGSEVRLSANLPAGTTGTWSFVDPNSTAAFIEDPFDPSTSISDLLPGSNLLTWTLSSENCEDYSADTIQVFRSEGLTANEDAYFNVGQPLRRLDFLANDDIPNRSNIIFNFLTTPTFGSLKANGDGTYDFEFNTSSNENIEFSYEICLRDCPDICSQTTVSILSSTPAPPIKKPANVITPNGDGTGERLAIPNFDQVPPPIQLVVVNRWGNKVFETNNYDNNWDGRTNSGKRLPDGTYFYILTGSGGEVSGVVTIIR